jgi:hypothetical protein
MNISYLTSIGCSSSFRHFSLDNNKGDDESKVPKSIFEGT